MFENAVMLAGLGGAAAPVVIHLLGRARYRSVDWGAMMFIASDAPRWRDGAKLREWVLLSVRMAAVTLLAVALARPVGGIVGNVISPAGARSVAGGAPESRTATVIVIDCSASMAYEEIGGSRMDVARTAALQILSTLRRGDRAAVIAAGTAQPPTPPQLTSDLQSLAARVSELKPTPGAADLADALSAAGDLLDREPGRSGRQLFVVCDRQARSWRNVTDNFATAWSASHGAPATFAVIPVGGADTDNASVDSVTLINPPAVIGCAMSVQVTVRNHGPAARPGLPLTLRLAGQEIATSTLNLAGGESNTVIMPLRFPTAGTQVLSAELRGGGPNLDDRRDYVVDVSPPLRVLIVHGGATDQSLLAAALAPYAAAGRAGADLAAVRSISVAEWDPSRLAEYRVIVLDDVPAPTAAQSAALEQFVYAGGGLMIAPGPAARIELYNQSMYREEGGLLPALLQPVVAPPAPLAVEPATLDTSQPLLRFLSERGGGAASAFDVAIERYFPTTGRTAAARILGSYTSGDPFLIESPFGRGRVVLVTCSLGASWSSLPLTSLYLPLMQSTAQYLAGESGAQRNLSAGQELVAAFEPEAPGGARAVVIRPDGSRDTCELSTIDRRSEARYAKTDLPGLYTIRIVMGGGAEASAPRSAVFSVAPPAGESDLQPLAESDWKRLEGALSFTRIPIAGERPLGVRLGVMRRGGSEYWLAALVGVIALLVIELALTRAWSGEVDEKVTK